MAIKPLLNKDGLPTALFNRGSYTKGYETVPKGAAVVRETLFVLGRRVMAEKRTSKWRVVGGIIVICLLLGLIALWYRDNKTKNTQIKEQKEIKLQQIKRVKIEPLLDACLDDVEKTYNDRLESNGKKIIKDSQSFYLLQTDQWNSLKDAREFNQKKCLDNYLERS